MMDSTKKTFLQCFHDMLYFHAGLNYDKQDLCTLCTYAATTAPGTEEEINITKKDACHFFRQFIYDYVPTILKPYEPMSSLCMFNFDNIIKHEKQLLAKENTHPCYELQEGVNDINMKSFWLHNPNVDDQTIVNSIITHRCGTTNCVESCLSDIVISPLLGQDETTDCSFFYNVSLFFNKIHHNLKLHYSSKNSIPYYATDEHSRIQGQLSVSPSSFSTSKHDPTEFVGPLLMIYFNYIRGSQKHAFLVRLNKAISPLVMYIVDHLESIFIHRNASVLLHQAVLIIENLDAHEKDIRAGIRDVINKTTDDKLELLRVFFFLDIIRWNFVFTKQLMFVTYPQPPSTNHAHNKQQFKTYPNKISCMQQHPMFVLDKKIGFYADQDNDVIEYGMVHNITEDLDLNVDLEQIREEILNEKIVLSRFLSDGVTKNTQKSSQKNLLYFIKYCCKMDAAFYFNHVQHLIPTNVKYTTFVCNKKRTQFLSLNILN